MKDGKMQNSNKVVCIRPPKYCYFRKNRWVYYPNIPGQKRKEIPLRQGRNLLKADTPCHVIHNIVDEMIHAPSETISKLLEMYLNSEHVNNLSKNTRSGYMIYYKTMINMPTKNAKKFGDMPYEAVTPGVIRKYLDKRKAEKAPIAGNREVELLSASYNWAYERDKASKNPCKGVRHNSEKAKDVYVTDEQYNALLEVTKGHPMFYAIQIAYLCRARGIEAFDLDLNDLDFDKGVFVSRTKGSWSEWTSWSPSLRNAIEGALEHRKKVFTKLTMTSKPTPNHQVLLVTKEGKPFNKNARDSAWQRSYKKLVEMGIASMEKAERFSFHDLKAKGVSDHKNHESGHKSEKAKAVYLRKVKEVDATK